MTNKKAAPSKPGDRFPTENSQSVPKTLPTLSSLSMPLSAPPRRKRPDWPKQRLGDVCQTGAGGTPLKLHREYYEGGTIPWLLSGEVSQGEIHSASNFITQAGLDNSSAKIFPEDTVLVAMYGATAGQVGILRFRAATNQAVCGILPSPRFVPEFLFYFLLSRKEQLVAQATGNAQPNISQIKIRDTEVPVLTLPEQQRIVGILDEAFAGLATAKANAETNLQNARALFESHLHSVFTQRGSAWMDQTFEQLIQDNLIGLTKSSREQGDDKCYPYVKMNNITRDNRFDFSSFVTVDATDAEAERFALRNGDFLFNTRNSYELVGKTCIYEATSDDVTVFNNNIMRVRFREGIEAKFVLFAFSSKEVAEELNSLKSGTTNVSAIYFKDLKSLRVPVAPHKAQLKISTQLNALRAQTQRLESLYRQKLAALAALKKSLLHQAFTGQL